MIQYMSEVPPRATGDPLASRVLPQVRSALISQARKYLETRFVMSQFHSGSDSLCSVMPFYAHIWQF